MKTLRLPLAFAGALIALAALTTDTLTAERPDPLAGFADDPRLAPIKQVQRRAMLAKQRAKIAHAIEAKQPARGAKKRAGTMARGPRVEVGAATPREAKQVYEALKGDLIAGGGALGVNVRANDPTGDSFGHGQAEASMAARGSNILIAWNDGRGFDLASNDIQGGAYSTNGGVSFTDFGIPPKPANWTWNSDPSITVNEKTGTFYYCALIDRVVGANIVENGIAVVSATFSGPSLVWGTPVLAVQAAPNTISFDKQWIAADSTSDSVYIAYTNFNGTTGSQIDLVRSANGTTWSSATKLSSTAGNGLVHGARPAVGPNGEVYVIWSEIGPIDVDLFRIKLSTNAGASYGTEFTLPTYYANFGTGAPGFNRERGITFPSIAVDRSSGANRGRLYVAWNESVNWYDDLTVPAVTTNESEPNNTAATADPFTLGQRLTGNITAVLPTADQDFFSFSATQGTDVVMRLIPTGSLDLAWRLLCSDGTTQLALSNLGVGAEAYIVFTIPVTGTYYVRPAPFTTSGTGTYQIYTKASVPGAERARDHRDVFVSTSSNRGQTWTTPVLVNADAGNFDNWLPEVAVGANGIPYVMWYDWRDTPPANCGGWSNVYLSRSDNGGTSWTEVGLVSDAQTPWTSVTSNIAPNQGDYLFLFANDLAVYPVWYDGRNGDPDTYVSTITLAVTPTTASLVSAVALTDRVTLTWSAPGAASRAANVYRRQGAGVWSLLAATTVDASDRVAHVDEGVTPGRRYGYRLGILEDGAETFTGETEVEVPSGVAFGLRSVGPNPASGELWVTFALATAQPASLELYDVSGRQVRSVDLAAAAGVHREALLRGGEKLPAGVYVVMLRQGERTATSRVSLVN